MLLVAKNIISDSNLFFYLYNFSQSTTFEYNSQDSSSYLIFRILASLAPSVLLVSLINVTVRISLTFRILTLDAIGVVALTVFFYLVKPAKPQEYKTASELKQDN